MARRRRGNGIEADPSQVQVVGIAVAQPAGTDVAWPDIEDNED